MKRPATKGRTPQSTDSANPAVLALQLLGAWNRIARGHVSLSAGCSCGVGFTGLMVQDFEAQILEFLEGRHGRRADSVAALLTAIAKSPGENATPILCDLARTIESFEAQHAGR